MKLAVILPAAGLGKRFSASANAGSGMALSKIEAELGGKAVFLRAIELFTTLEKDTAWSIEQVILAVNPDTIEDFRARWGGKLDFMGVKLVPGGKAERWETVLRTLDALNKDITHVAVHDAARPMTDAKVIARVFDAARRHPAVIPGISAIATLKKVEVIGSAVGGKSDPLGALLGASHPTAPPLRKVVATVDRSSLVEVQTPQVFEVGLLRRAYQQITDGKLTGAKITDDAGLVESLGEEVVVVEGASTNIKVTRPEDLELATAFITAREQKQLAASARRKLLGDDDE